MITRLLVLICFTAFAAIVFAQENPIAWKESNILFSKEVDGKIFGFDGYNYWVSSNNGIDWKSLTEGLWREGTSDHYSFFNFDKYILLYNTSKHADTWELELGRGFYFLMPETYRWKYIRLPQESYDSTSLINIIALNKDTMFAQFLSSTKAILYKTTDQGSSWINITVAMPLNCFIKEFFAIGGGQLVMNAYSQQDSVMSAYPSYFISTDYGSSWVIGGDGLPDSTMAYLRTSDGKNNAICTVKEGISPTKNYLYITHDGFRSFSKFSIGEHFGFPDGSFGFSEIQLIDSLLFVSIPLYRSNSSDQGSETYYSLDTGKNWTIINDPDSLLTYPGSRIASLQGGYIIIGNGYFRLEHLDSIGERLYFGPITSGQCRKVMLIDEEKLFTTKTCGFSNHISVSGGSYSIDAGVEWSSWNTDTIRLTDSKWLKKENKIYAPGWLDSNALIFTSIDNGSIWLPTSPIEKGVEAHWVQVSGDTLIVILSNGHVYSSITNGASWEELSDSTVPLLADIEPILSAGKVFCITKNKKDVAAYSYNTDTWALINLPDTLPAQGEYRKVALHKNDLYLYPKYAYNIAAPYIHPVYRSTDNGETWERFVEGLPDSSVVTSNTEYGEYIYLMVAIPAASNGHNNNLYYLRDGETVWKRSSISSYLTSNVYVNDKHVFVLNDRGLYRYPLSFVGVSPTANEPRIGELIALINPFTDVLQLKYDLDKSSVVRIDLYDLLGRSMYSEEQGYKQDGQHTLSLQSKGWSPGSYFVRLSTSTGEVKTIKLLKK